MIRPIRNKNDRDHSNLWVIMIVKQTPRSDRDHLVIEDSPSDG